MKHAMKKQLILLVAGATLVGGLLTGCGSSTAAASTSNGSGNNQDAQNGQGKNGQHRGNFNFAAQLTKAGLSQTDAQNLATLIRSKHVQPKWVLDQVNNKVPVSQITDDINNGKAPTMQPRNGNGNWNGNGGNGNRSNGSSNNSGSGSNGGSSNSSSNASSSNGTSN